MINQISDGQPITYELLNQIIEQVNKVSTSDLNDVKQIVEVIGSGIKRTEDARAIIAAGSITVVIPKTSNIPIQTIKFSEIFAANPYVSVTIVDVNTSKQDGGLNAATATVVGLTASEMQVKIQLIRQIESATSIRLHYIAVGPSSNA